MKTSSKLLPALVITLILPLVFGSGVMAQSTWEGKFMNQFQVNISFDGLGTGELKMYDGSSLIQHDGLIKVVIDQDRISFAIPAKQTDFKGELLESGSIITGNFIFPDGTLHSLTVHKQVAMDKQAWEISQTQAAEDLHQLYMTIKEHHPEPFQYITPTEFERLYSSVARIDDDPVPVLNFYLRASRLTEAVKCSHTGLRLPDKLRQEIDVEFPLEVFLEKDILYLLDNQHQDLPGGTIITKINEIPVEELIARLNLLVPVNGMNNTTKANVINRQFKTMLPLVVNTKEYKLTCRNKGEITEITLPAKKRQVVQAEAADVIIFEPRSAVMAYLKIPSFGIRDMDRYFANLEDIFSTLKSQGTQNLVLDLRDNSGGHPIFAAQLLSYLTLQEFTYFDRNEGIMEFEPLYYPMQPNKLQYEGNLFVFVNGGCLSTSGHLISLLKQYSKAKFIGEEPGSTYSCNDFSKEIILANSQLELNIPTTTFRTAVQGEAKEVPFPIDFTVRETVLDKLAGRDVYWETFKQAIIPQEAY